MHRPHPPPPHPRRRAGARRRPVPGRRPGGVRRRPEPGHARRLHRLRLRPVPDARAVQDERLAGVVAVPGGRHLHLRQEPRLPRPAQPHAGVGEHAAREGLAAAADHARAAGRLPRPVPALRRRPDDHPDARARTAATARPASRAPPRPPPRSRRRPGSASCRAARSGTTSRASTSTTPPAASRPCGSSAAGPSRSAGSATSPASTPASGRASRCSTTRGSQRPGVFTLPDRIWLARWDGLANTSSDYILEDGWRPGGRMKQYKGGHDERWGGVKINIDSNFLELGNGLVAPAEVHCGGTRVNFKDYPRLAPPKAGKRPGQAHGHRAEVPAPASRASTPGNLKGEYTPQAGRGHPRLEGAARHEAPRTPGASATGWPCSPRRRRRNPVVKVGSTGGDVRRLQRALNAANETARLPSPACSTASPTGRCAPTRPATGSRSPASPGPRRGARWPAGSARRGPPRPAR